MSLCLAAAGIVVALGADAITLQWRHSVEKILWQEDWLQSGNRILMTEARILGSGAGMEPPPEARLIGGAWRWKPDLPPQISVSLRRSAATVDWQICTRGQCQWVHEIIKDADPVTLGICPAP